MTSEYENQIKELRDKREKIINRFRSNHGVAPVKLEYFPIDPAWCVEGEIVNRKPKPDLSDYTIKYTKIGSIKLGQTEKFNLKASEPRKFALIHIENDPDSLCFFIMDGSNGKSTYDGGRFVPVIKKGDKYFAEFNAAFSPACGYINAPCPMPSGRMSLVIEAGEKYTPSD